MANTKIPSELSNTPSISDSGDATAITIDSSERVGIGTTSPSSRLHLSYAGDPEVRLTNTSTSQTLRLDHNSIRSSTAHSIHLLANDLGNRKLTVATDSNNDTRNLIGIGTSSPEAALHMLCSGSHNNTADAHFFLSKNSNSDWSMYLAAGNDDYGFRTDGNGSYAVGVYNQPASAWRFRVDYSGVIYANNTTVQSISDERLKENVTDANSQWNDIKNLRFVNYEWIDDKYGDGTYLGLIAQEVEEISPNLVEIDAQPKEDIDAGIEDPEYKTVKYSVVWMKAMKALQEAMTKIETLEEKVRVLEGG